MCSLGYVIRSILKRKAAVTAYQSQRMRVRMRCELPFLPAAGFDLLSSFLAECQTLHVFICQFAQLATGEVNYWLIAGVKCEILRNTVSNI